MRCCGRLSQISVVLWDFQSNTPTLLVDESSFAYVSLGPFAIRVA